METYPMADYCLKFSDDYKTLYVFPEGGTEATVDFNLETDLGWKVEVQGENYQIEEGDGGLGYEEEFELIADAEWQNPPSTTPEIIPSPPVGFFTNKFIGVTDLRFPSPTSVTRRVYTYWLENCPVTLRKSGSQKMTVKSLCSGDCMAPNTGCRDVIDETYTKNT